MPYIVDYNPSYQSEERRRDRDQQEKQSQRQFLLSMLGLGANTALSIRGQNQQAEQFSERQKLDQSQFSERMTQDQTQFDANQARMKQARDDMLATRDREWKRETDERQSLARLAGRPDPDFIGPPPDENELMKLPTEELRMMARTNYADQHEKQKNQYAAKRAADLIDRRMKDGTLTPEQAQRYVSQLELLPESSGAVVDDIEGLAKVRFAAESKALRGAKSAMALDPLIEHFEMGGASDEDIALMRYSQSLVKAGELEPGKFLDKVFELRQQQAKKGAAPSPQELQSLYPNMPPERAAALSSAMGKGAKFDLPEVASGDPRKMQAVVRTPEVVEAEMRMETAKDELKQAREADALKSTAETKARVSEATTEFRLRQNTLARIMKGQSSSKQAAPAKQSAAPAKAAASVPSDRAIDQAWAELGQEADPQEVVKRAQEIDSAAPNK